MIIRQIWGLLAAVAALITVSSSAAAPPSVAELRARHGWPPRFVVKHGLPAGRDWVLSELLWTIEFTDRAEYEITALQLAGDFGDSKSVEELQRIASRSEDEDKAHRIRRVANRIWARLLKSDEDRLAFWTPMLDGEDGYAVAEAVDALGDIAQSSLVPLLQRLQMEAASVPDVTQPSGVAQWHRHRRRYHASLAFKIKVAMEKIRRMSGRNPFDVYSEAAKQKPDFEFEGPTTGLSEIKAWGIERLGALRTQAAQDLLTAMLIDYESLYSQALAAAGANRGRARESFLSLRADEYVRLIHAALLQSGRDVATERGLLVREFLWHR